MYMIRHYLQKKMYVFEIKYKVPSLKHKDLHIALSSFPADIILQKSLDVELKFMLPPLKVCSIPAYTETNSNIILSS